MNEQETRQAKGKLLEKVQNKKSFTDEEMSHTYEILHPNLSVLAVGLYG